MLQVKVDSHMLNALTADLTARCVLKTKYKHESRHSKDAIAWANSRAEKLTTAMLKHIGKENAAFNAAFNAELNIVKLLDFHNRAYICYDLFLDGLDEHIRLEIERSIERPIFLISRRGDVLHVNRGNKGVDAMVADELKDIGEFDKGPRPYFVDVMNPPLYCDGKRIENPAELMSGSGEGENGEDLSLSEEDEDGKKGEQDSLKEVAVEDQVVT